MRLSMLSRAMYRILRLHALASRVAYASITYAELARELNQNPRVAKAYPGLSHKDTRLDNALGQLVLRCRERGLPALPAIVVRQDLRVPGAKYYGTAHPHARGDRPSEMIAWALEFWAVFGCTYPGRL